MKYLTKEWYRLCQLTDLHGDLSIHPLASEKSESFFEITYAKKEAAYVETEQAVYNTDPRFLLEEANSSHLSLKALLLDLALDSGDRVILETSDKERREIEKQIEAFDRRMPFDPEAVRESFREQYERKLEELPDLIPPEILALIPDRRIFALGVCSREIYDRVKSFSTDNEDTVEQRLKDFEEAQMKEDLPDDLAVNFGAHDALVLNIEISDDVVLTLDPEGSFTTYKEIRFKNATVKKADARIIGSYWVYNELYRDDDRYEAHILFSGSEVSDLILCCDEILMK